MSFDCGYHQPQKKQHPTKVPPNHIREIKKPSEQLLFQGNIVTALLNGTNLDYPSIELKYAAGYHWKQGFREW